MIWIVVTSSDFEAGDHRVIYATVTGAKLRAQVRATNYHTIIDDVKFASWIWCTTLFAQCFEAGDHQVIFATVTGAKVLAQVRATAKHVF